ncbi:hypothetical protein [Pseudooceanicola nanhaiensis]|jgi:hypothetical protein|uniref:Uncharacterized protein n=2 Tax=Pseudooceanicola nanhaiensis TaxID=375761 RepID=A0A917SVN4_9RHOB|nr:hypothetical protein [Pseudooceanicola nanhaiensis]GGM01090.1 hypothetical protein GCM10011534_23650 [Pseudooceanicola nanhaiensis]
MKALTFATAALLMAVLMAPDAAQARACAPRENVLARLAEGYGESRKSIGIGANNQVVEVFASDESGTWTITVTSPAGVTCLVASGQAYEALAEALPDTSDPA